MLPQDLAVVNGLLHVKSVAMPTDFAPNLPSLRPILFHAPHAYAIRVFIEFAPSGFVKTGFTGFTRLF